MAVGRPIHAVSSLNVGGAERLVIDLALVQRRAGLDPLILSFGRSQDDLYEHARESNVPVALLADAGSQLRQLRTILNIVRSAPPLALHIHSPWCLRKLAPVLPFVRCNIVYTRHGAHEYRSLSWRLLHKWVHRHVDHLTFVSQQACDVHRHLYRAVTVAHHVLEFGVQTHPEQIAAPTPERLPLRIGSVGRLVEVKGQRHLIDAVAAMRGAPVQLHVFGDGPDRKALEAQAAVQLPGRAHFHGNVIDRTTIYNGIDVLVVASRTEGLSLAIMEAMTRGVAVVATDVGGNGRLVSPADTGILIPYGDVAAMTAALELLVNDSRLRQRLAGSARAHVAANFSLENAAARLTQLYGFK